MSPMRACVFAVVLIAGCARQEEPPAVDRPSVNPGVSEARVRELEHQARALAKTEGCDQATQCAAAPMGAKACGGPRTYIVYCRATTDEEALLRTLDELKRAEEAYNKEAGLVSDCMLVTPPAVRLEAGSCTAASR